MQDEALCLKRLPDIQVPVDRHSDHVSTDYGGYLPTRVGATDYTFLTATGGIQGTFSNITFTGLVGYDYHVTYGSNSILLELDPNNAVPEPGNLALLTRAGIVGAGILARRRK